MATDATYAVEELLAVDDGGANDRVLGDDAARDLQSGLEQGSGVSGVLIGQNGPSTA